MKKFICIILCLFLSSSYAFADGGYGMLTAVAKKKGGAPVADGLVGWKTADENDTSTAGTANEDTGYKYTKTTTTAGQISYGHIRVGGNTDILLGLYSTDGNRKYAETTVTTVNAAVAQVNLPLVSNYTLVDATDYQIVWGQTDRVGDTTMGRKTGTTVSRKDITWTIANPADATIDDEDTGVTYSSDKNFIVWFDNSATG